MGRLNDEDLTNILARHQANDPWVYIETGTWKGTQLAISVRHFKRVYGIELDAHYAEVSQQTAPDATVIHGDTSDELPVLLDRYEDEALFLVLDAHYFATADPPLEKSPFPLWGELDLLRQRSQPDIISVDDVHTFGVTRDDLRYEEGVQEWEGVTTESILEFMGDRVVDSEVIGDSFILWMRDDTA